MAQNSIRSSAMRLLLCVLLAALLVPAQSQGVTLYQVGNSLTVDAQPVQAPNTAAAAGITLSAGQHQRCNSSLTTILLNPTETCVAPLAPYGNFSNALPNYAWDHVVLQSHAAQNSTMGLDEWAFNSFVNLTRQNPANANTQFYLFQAWPAIQDLDDFELPVADTLAQPTIHRRDYFDKLLTRIQATVPGTRMVPTAEVFYRVAEEIEAGNVAGVASFSELYRDGLHASFGLGRFVANTTVATTVLQTDFTGLDTPYSATFASGPYSTTTRDQLQAIIWDVVKHHPDAGISQSLMPGDYNGDGAVTATDLTVWKSLFGSTTHLSADGNHDGRVDSADYTVWRDAFAQMAAIGGGAGVPEPSSAVLATAGAVLALAALRARRPQR